MHSTAGRRLPSPLSLPPQRHDPACQGATLWKELQKYLLHSFCSLSVRAAIRMHKFTVCRYTDLKVTRNCTCKHHVGPKGCRRMWAERGVQQMMFITARSSRDMQLCASVACSHECANSPTCGSVYFVKRGCSFGAYRQGLGFRL